MTRVIFVIIYFLFISSVESQPIRANQFTTNVVPYRIVIGTTNTIAISGSVTGSPVSITSSGIDSGVFLDLITKSSWSNSAGGVRVNSKLYPDYVDFYHTFVGSPPAPVDLVISQKLPGYYNGLMIPNAGDGARTNSGVTASYPYIEFWKFGGTASSPANVGPNWYLGEIAFNSFGSPPHGQALLMDVVTDSSTHGQLELCFDGTQGNPQMVFSSNRVVLQPAVIMGGTSFSEISSGLEVHRDTTTANVVVSRGDNSNYAYTGFRPSGGLGVNNVSWGSGLYGGNNNYTIWSFDGNANFTHVVLTPSGNMGLLCSPLTEFHVNGSAIITNTIITSNLYLGYVASPVTNGYLNISAGTSTKVPIQLTSGTLGSDNLLTNGLITGAIEYSNHTFFATTFKVRRSIALVQNVVLTNNVTTNITTGSNTFYVVPMAANYLSVGKMIEPELSGLYWQSAGAGAHIFIEVWLAGTRIFTFSPPTGIVNGEAWRIRPRFTCRSVGIGATVVGSLEFVGGVSGGSVSDHFLYSIGTATFNSTVDNTLDFVCTNNQSTASWNLIQGRTLCMDSVPGQ